MHRCVCVCVCVCGCSGLSTGVYKYHAHSALAAEATYTPCFVFIYGLSVELVILQTNPRPEGGLKRNLSRPAAWLSGPASVCSGALTTYTRLRA